jgi:hypothetical protein
MSNADCGNLAPVRTTAAGFVFGNGCSGRALGPLDGRAVGTAVRYHVGIRHYVATSRYVLAACAGSNARAESIADAASRW